MRRLALLSLALVVSVAAAQAASPRPTLQSYLDAVVKAGSPGAVGIARNGNTTERLVAGVADRKTRAPMQMNDRFRVGSITKSFVAAVVLQLVAAGNLSLDDNVDTLLPGLLAGGAGITIRELLQHTSGLYDYVSDPRVLGPYLKGALGYNWTPAELLEIAASHPALFPPGSRWSYSNTNYILLGLIVRAATGRSIGNQLSKAIFGPLHLQATSFEAGRHIGAPAAHGYYAGTDVTTLSGSWAWAAGAIVSTADDVADFYRALLGGKVIPPALMRAMESTVATRSGPDGYGLGLLRLETPCGPAFGHNGLVPGYASYAISSRDGRRQAVILMTVRNFPISLRLTNAENAFLARAYCG